MFRLCSLLETLLTSDLLHQHRLREANGRTAATFVHSNHSDLQAVTSGLVLDNKAGRLLQFLIDCFPVLSWMRKITHNDE